VGAEAIEPLRRLAAPSAPTGSTAVSRYGSSTVGTVDSSVAT